MRKGRSFRDSFFFGVMEIHFFRSRWYGHGFESIFQRDLSIFFFVLVPSRGKCRVDFFCYENIFCLKYYILCIILYYIISKYLYFKNIFVHVTRFWKFGIYFFCSEEFFSWILFLFFFSIYLRSKMSLWFCQKSEIFWSPWFSTLL